MTETSRHLAHLADEARREVVPPTIAETGALLRPDHAVSCVRVVCLLARGSFTIARRLSRDGILGCCTAALFCFTSRTKIKPYPCQRHLSSHAVPSSRGEAETRPAERTRRQLHQRRFMVLPRRRVVTRSVA